MTPSYWNRETQCMFFLSEEHCELKNDTEFIIFYLVTCTFVKAFNITRRLNSLEICKCVVIVRTTCRCRQRLLSPKKAACILPYHLNCSLFNHSCCRNTWRMLQAAWLHTFLSFKIVVPKNGLLCLQTSTCLAKQCKKITWWEPFSIHKF